MYNIYIKELKDKASIMSIDEAAKQMSTQNIIAFLDKQGIEWSPVHLEGKEPRFPNNWEMNYGQHMFFKMLEEPDKKRLKSLKQMLNWNSIAMDTRTIAMLDVDYYNKESKLSTDMSFLTNKHPWHKSITKGNPKIWVVLDRKPEKARYDTIWPGVELLCSQWSSARRVDDVFNANMPILEMSLSDIIKDNKNKPLKQMCQSPATEPLSDDLKGDTRVIDLIDGDKVSDYHDWLAVLAAMYHSGYSLSDAHTVSSRASNYDSDSVDAKWAEASKLSGYSFGTVCHYAKESNPDGFKELHKQLKGESEAKCLIKLPTPKLAQTPATVTVSKEPEAKPEPKPEYNFDAIEDELYTLTKEFTNGNVGEIFKVYHGDGYVYCRKQWYRLNAHGIYERLEDDAETVLMQKCVNSLRVFISDQVKKHVNNSDRLKILTDGLKQSQKNQFMKNTVDMLRMLFLDEALHSKLDKNLNLVGFKNGVYDLANGVFRDATRQDYVSITTGYDYTEESNDAYFDRLIASIFENEERAKWFKVHLGSLLVGGNPEEKVYFWVGAGRNGKGTMDKLIRYALGAYYGDIQASYFTTPDVAGRASPEVMAFKNIRCGMTQEPASGEQQKWNTEKLKKISGGDPLTGRHLYGSPETFNPHHKQLVSTNHLPTFTDIDDGLKSRLVVVRFPLQFMDADNFDDTMPSHRKQNAGLKVELDQYQHMFFNYMLKQYAHYKAGGLPTMPGVMLDDLREYQSDIDSVKVFLKNTLVPCENQFVSITGLHQMFKQQEDMAINTFSSRVKKLGYTAGRRTVFDKKTTCIIGYDWRD